MSFLTKLDRPKIWRGYPFLLSAIVTDGLYLIIRGYDSAGTLLDTVEYSEGSLINKVVGINPIEIYGSDTPDYLVVSTDLLEEAEMITLDIADPCENPVYLLGRNSLGGVLDWMFDYSQDYTFDYGNGRKAARKVLFAQNLTLNQWESLQDFITLGEVYRNNIVEFLATTIKTSSRIGQQVYAVDSDGNKIGVVVIATRNTTRTKQVKHTFEIEIEYPEQFAV